MLKKSYWYQFMSSYSAGPCAVLSSLRKGFVGNFKIELIGPWEIWMKF